MSRAEYDAMVAKGRVQPNLDGREMKHVTAPPDPNGFLAYDPGSLFVEFDIDDAQVAPGGRQGWYIIYGQNSIHGRNAVRNGKIPTELPLVHNVIVLKVDEQ